MFYSKVFICDLVVKNIFNLVCLLLFSTICFIDVTENWKYCYKFPKCFGEKESTSQQRVVSFEECCQVNGGGSWGLADGKCMPCKSK